MNRWAVRARSTATGELVWVTPLGRLTHEPHRAATYANQARANELALRLPRWEEVEIVPAPDTRVPAPEPEAKAKPNSATTDWAGVPDEKGLQVRRRRDGTTVYRARRQGHCSPTFEVLEAARSWQP